MAKKPWYTRNALVPSHPSGMDPFAHTGRRRTSAGARQRRESVEFNKSGVQIDGSAGGGGTARGDAGYWGRKKRYASRARSQRKIAGAQMGSPSGTGGDRRSRRRK